jgi:hypothetical protein
MINRRWLASIGSGALLLVGIAISVPVDAAAQAGGGTSNARMTYATHSRTLAQQEAEDSDNGAVDVDQGDNAQVDGTAAEDGPGDVGDDPGENEQVDGTEAEDGPGDVGDDDQVENEQEGESGIAARMVARSVSSLAIS